MIRTLLVSAVIASGAWAAAPLLPASPLTELAPQAAPAAPVAALPAVAVRPVAACPTPQTAPQTAPQAPAAAPAADGRVNLNTATAAELDALPNVGAKTAARILALQPRVTLEAVQKLPGMTAAHWAELAPHVTV